MQILNWKRREGDLESAYRLRVEVGLILSLLALLILFNIHLSFRNNEQFTVPDQETVKMTDIVQTKINQKPPPPPVPQVPVAVSNDAIVQDHLNFTSSELSIGTPIDLPAKPPSENKKATKDQKDQIFIAVQKMPRLIGGPAAIEKNIHYPKMALKAGIEGTVIVQFVVSPKGIPIDLKIVRSVGAGLDQAALNAVRKVRFTPGIQRGRPVPVRMTVPVRFELRNK